MHVATDTIILEPFVSNFFLYKIFVLNLFYGPLQAMKVIHINICYRQIIVRLIFVVRLPHKNILLMNISKLQYMYACMWNGVVK